MMWLQHQCCNPSGRMANEAAAPVAAARQVGRWGGGGVGPLCTTDTAASAHASKRASQGPHGDAGEPAWALDVER